MTNCNQTGVDRDNLQKAEEPFPTSVPIPLDKINFKYNLNSCSPHPGKQPRVKLGAALQTPSILIKSFIKYVLFYQNG